MSKEVQVLTWCDLEREGKAVAGSTYVLAVDGLRREIDLCDPHADHLGIARLRKTLEESGRPVSAEAAARPTRRGPAPRTDGVRGGRKPGAGRPFLCPWCPFDYATSQALLVHATNVHGQEVSTGPGAVSRLLGGQCPLCDVRTEMMQHHTTKEHGVPWPTAVAQARKEGHDPLGVIAALDARALANSP